MAYGHAKSHLQNLLMEGDLGQPSCLVSIIFQSKEDSILMQMVQN